MATYPTPVIRQQASCRRQELEPCEKTRWHGYAVVPYVRGDSEAIRRVLTPLKVRVCYKPHRTLRQLLSRPKDPIPDLKKSGVVYKVPCASCSASYIGQSGRKLETMDKGAQKSGGHGRLQLVSHSRTCLDKQSPS